MVKFQYTDRDHVAVKLYLISGNKTEAYKFSRVNGDQLTKSSMVSSTARYFKTEKIKILIALEKSKMQKNFPDIVDRCELKEYDHVKGMKENKQTVVSIKDMDKEQAIQRITSILDASPNDKQTAKELFPLLTKLKGWEKETITKDSNVVQYHLPNNQ